MTAIIFCFFSQANRWRRALGSFWPLLCVRSGMMAMIVILGFHIDQARAASPATTALAPREVVERWLTWYPKHLSRAAELTTRTFRQGLSQAEWVATRGPELRNLQLRYVRAKIAHQEIAGEEARVIVNAHVITALGDHAQDEVYFLKKSADGYWRIDRVEVYLDNFNRPP